MDSGWAIVLGAVIALTGSALVPWLRDSRTAARVRREQSQERRNAALIDLLAANSALASSSAFRDRGGVLAALEARARAATALSLEVPVQDRSHLAMLIDFATPLRRDNRKVSPRVSVLALQLTLTAWASTDGASSGLYEQYLGNVLEAEAFISGIE